MRAQAPGSTLRLAQADGFVCFMAGQVRKYSPPLRSPSPPPPPSPSPPPPPPPRPAKQPDPAASARAAGGRMEAYSASAATSTDFAEAVRQDANGIPCFRMRVEAAVSAPDGNARLPVFTLWLVAIQLLSE
eukprot:6190369-Pleurochrysis_carterae.AAC.2